MSTHYTTLYIIPGDETAGVPVGLNKASPALDGAAGDGVDDQNCGQLLQTVVCPDLGAPRCLFVPLHIGN